MLFFFFNFKKLRKIRKLSQEVDVFFILVVLVQ